MNKKLIICLLIALLLLCGCRNVANTQDTQPFSTDPISAQSTEQTEPQVIPGLVYSPNEDSNLPDDTEDDPAANPSEEPTTPSEPDKPTEPTAPTESETPTEPTVPSEPASTSFEQYNAMSPEEQYAFFCTFSSMEDFVAWYNNAKAEYEAAHPGIDIGDGNIDIGDIIGGNP